MEVSRIVTIAILTYNEERSIASVLEDFLKLGANIVLIDGGSSDSTLRIASKYPVKVIVQKKRGYLEAYKIACRESDESVFIVDGDGQYRAAFLPLLYNVDGDIVYGYKLFREDPPYRVVLSKICNFIARALFNVKYSDMNSGYKLLNTYGKIVCEYLKYLKYTPGIELLVRAHHLGLNIKAVPIIHFKRVCGKTRLMRGALKVILSTLIGMLKLKLEMLKPLVCGAIKARALSLFKRNYSRVYGALYIGGARYPKGRFNRVIDVRYLPEGKYVPTRELDKLATLINKVWSDVTLVHCKWGRGRAVLAVTAFLIKHKGMTPVEAYEYIKARHSTAYLNREQLRSLWDYYRRCVC